MRLTLALIVSLAAALPAFADDVVLPDGKAKTLIENTCTECHGLEQVVNNPMTAEKWRSTVNRMVKKGATLSSEEIDTVVEYLSVYFPPDKVNVNTATSQEIQAGCALRPLRRMRLSNTAKRTATSRIWQRSKKAAGLDAKKIEAKKDQVAF